MVTFVPAVNHLHVMLSGLNLLASWTMLEMNWIVRSFVPPWVDVDTTHGSLMKMKEWPTTASFTLAVPMRTTAVLAADQDQPTASMMLKTGNKYLEPQQQAPQHVAQLLILLPWK